MTSTTYSPSKVSEFTANNLNFKGQGIIFTCALNDQTTTDYQLPEDRLLTSASLYVKDASWGDSLVFQVVDKDGVLEGIAYPPGTPRPVVLKEFMTSWYVCTDQQKQDVPSIAYPAKVFQGLYLRTVYTATAVLGAQPKVAVNYHMHKVLL